MLSASVSWVFQCSQTEPQSSILNPQSSSWQEGKRHHRSQNKSYLLFSYLRQSYVMPNRQLISTLFLAIMLRLAVRSCGAFMTPCSVKSGGNSRSNRFLIGSFTASKIGISPLFSKAASIGTAAVGHAVRISSTRQYSKSSSSLESNLSEVSEEKLTALLWLRTSLRISDNEALSKAASIGRDGLAIVFTWERGDIPSTPSAVFECAAARELDRMLRERHGHHLTVISTDENPVNAISSAVQRLKPNVVVVDASSSENFDTVQELHRALTAINEDEFATRSPIDLVPITDDGSLMPFSVVPAALGRSRQGGRVFRWPIFLSNMSKNFDKVPLPCPAPSTLPSPLDSLDDSDALPLPTAAGLWAENLMKEWGGVSEDEAMNRATVLKCSEENNGETAETTSPNTTVKLGNRGAVNISTRLSPYLRWGVISPRQAFHAGGVRRRDLLWRDWSHVCYRAVGPLRRGEPVLPVLDKSYTRALDGKLLFDGEEARFAAWCLGQTGSPVVDAGMRQLWYEGWMPRNIRLLSATCLVEGLGLDWRKGRDWFEHTLLDHDPAINELMWQNAGFCGLDTFYKGLLWENENECGAMIEDPEYVKRWLSQELVWPPELSQRKKELVAPSNDELLAAANACREGLKRGGHYKAAGRVANTGVRIVWEKLESNADNVPVGEVWGLGRVPIDDVKFHFKQTPDEDLTLASNR